MKVLETKYRIYVGDDLVNTLDSIEEAKEEFAKIPSGQGKAPSKRRELVKEEVLLKDTR